MKADSFSKASEAQAPPEGGQVLTLHIAEQSEALVQEAYEETVLGDAELQQVTLPFNGTAEFSIITPGGETSSSSGGPLYG